jgi:hypothetical protein
MKNFHKKKKILKPFSGKNLTECDRVTNYRISRVRRVVGNAFGIQHINGEYFLEELNSMYLVIQVLH